MIYLGSTDYRVIIILVQHIEQGSGTHGYNCALQKTSARPRVFFSPAALTDASPCCPNTIKLWACREKTWHWGWRDFRCSFVAMTLIIFSFSPSYSGIFICFPWRKVLLGFPNPFLLIFWRHQERPGHALFFFSVFPPLRDDTIADMTSMSSKLSSPNKHWIQSNIGQAPTASRHVC